MRRLLAATIVGAALSTPVFAADAADAPLPALTIWPATIAAASTLVVPWANTHPATRFRLNDERPPSLPTLYATWVALQGYDTFSTLSALRNGGHDANPLMSSVVKSPVAFVAVKTGVTAASIMAAEHLWKNQHRTAAIGMMIASNVAMSMVAAHNSRALSQLK